jgi:hypothetical protein
LELDAFFFVGSFWNLIPPISSPERATIRFRLKLYLLFYAVKSIYFLGATWGESSDTELDLDEISTSSSWSIFYYSLIKMPKALSSL